MRNSNCKHCSIVLEKQDKFFWSSVSGQRQQNKKQFSLLNIFLFFFSSDIIKCTHYKSTKKTVLHSTYHMISTSQIKSARFNQMITCQLTVHKRDSLNSSQNRRAAPPVVVVPSQYFVYSVICICICIFVLLEEKLSLIYVQLYSVP